MTKQMSIKTRFGWISAYENKGKVFKIKLKKKLLEFEKKLGN
jgi:hypothetical protein